MIDRLNVNDERRVDATRRAKALEATGRGLRLLSVAGETDPADVLRSTGILAMTRRDGSIVLTAPDKSVLVLSKGTQVVKLLGTMEESARKELAALTKPVFGGHIPTERESFEPMRPAETRPLVSIGGNKPPEQLTGSTGGLDMDWPEGKR